MFVDDFFGDADGALPVVVVPIVEPILGTNDFDSASSFSPALAYRMAIPRAYDAGHDVTMRLFFFRTGPFDGDCLIFSVDARRLRNGQPGPQCYDGDAGDNCAAGRRWITVTPPPTDVSAGLNGHNGLNSGAYLVVDLPINTARGLNLPNDLAASDFLAFELQTVQHDGGQYEILGVEFFEGTPGSATTVGAAIFSSAEDACCDAVPSGPGPSFADDHLLIADAETLRVTDIATFGVVSDIPGTLATSGGFDDGHHMVFDTLGGRIFVSDHDQPFMVFDLTLTRTSPVFGVQLVEPLGIATLPDGKLLITDEENTSGLFRLNADLSFHAGITESVFDGPEGVAYDAIHDRILVADEDAGEIEVFDGTTLEHLSTTTVCGSDGPYWIAVDGSTGRVFFLADTPCPDSPDGLMGIHVYDWDCSATHLSFNRTLVTSEGKGDGGDCYGALTVSESTDRLFAIDFCNSTVDVFETGTLERLGVVPVGRTGESPLMISVGHFGTVARGADEEALRAARK
jgi:DNA-binding beta-propeller fold protein YncE